MNSHKLVGWKLFFDGLHAKLSHHGGTVDQMDFDILMLAFNKFDVIEFNTDEFVI